MPLFVDSSDIEYTFTTRLGSVSALASVSIEGRTLTIKDVVFYPVGADYIALGVRSILEMARTVEQLAGLEGFTEVVMIGKRLTGAMPGRFLYLRRRIR